MTSSTIKLKRVIVNADDFGVSANINRGLVEAFRAGMVKSASILANGDAVEGALEIAESPGLGVGIHLTVVCGKPVSSPEKVSSLLFTGGNFAPGYGKFIQHYLLGQIKISEVEYEWESQRERLSRIDIDHIDSHQHLHLLPGLFDLTVRLAKRWRVKFVRIPYENFEIGLRGHDLLPSNVLNIFTWGRKKRLEEDELLIPDNFFGSSFTGALTRMVWDNLLPKLPEGLTEIMCHPGCEDDNLRRQYGWKSRWEEELAALTSAEIITLAEQNGIEFTNFSEQVEG